MNIELSDAVYRSKWSVMIKRDWSNSNGDSDRDVEKACFFVIRFLLL